MYCDIIEPSKQHILETCDMQFYNRESLFDKVKCLACISLLMYWKKKKRDLSCTIPSLDLPGLFLLSFCLLVPTHSSLAVVTLPLGLVWATTWVKLLPFFCFWIGYNIHGRQTERWKVDFDKRKKWFEIGPRSYQTKQTTGFLVLCCAFLFTSLLGFKGVLCANWIFMEKK